MKNAKVKTKFKVNPYILSLLVFLVLIGIGGGTYLNWIIIKQVQQYGMRGNEIGMFIVCNIIYGSMLLIPFISPFEYMGTAEIRPEGIVFSAPLQKKRMFYYKDLHEFGIDYGFLTIDRQYWIYFCKVPFDRKYRHNINRMPFTKEYMRIQYREDVYKAIYAVAPKEAQKKWERHFNSVREAGYDKDKAIGIK